MSKCISNQKMIRIINLTIDSLLKSERAERAEEISIYDIINKNSLCQSDAAVCSCVFGNKTGFERWVGIEW